MGWACGQGLRGFRRSYNSCRFAGESPSGVPAQAAAAGKAAAVTTAIVKAKAAEMAAAVTKRLRPLDFAVFALSLGALTASIFAITGPATAARSRVEIRADNRAWRYSLNSETLLAVPGPLGETHIHIHEGAVSIQSSPCANQSCVHSPPATRPGQWIACLPNAVFIYVEGDTDSDDLDASSW